MHKLCQRCAALVLALAFLLPLTPPTQADFTLPTHILKVGLYNDGQRTYTSANLQNVSGAGWGYRFGYYDGERRFVDLGVTVSDTDKLTVMVDKNMVWDADSRRYTEGASGGTVVGCFHVQLEERFADQESAMAVARPLNGGGRNVFLKYEKGVYRVCVGNYISRDKAQEAGEALGLSAAWAVTSGTGTTVTVAETGTSRILFEFDYGTQFSLAIHPLPSGDGKTRTYFKGYQYYGDFAYIRPSGGSLTVVNMVDTEDYVKGVLPYEMSPTWPLEALKAQAICARTYAVKNLNKHGSAGFDICNETDCQVYRGVSNATAHSDSAAEATAGEYLVYQGDLCESYFYSHNGGATESCENVWLYPHGYLQGKTDPYEAAVVSQIPNYNWTVTFTGAQIATRLNNRGYAADKIVKFEIVDFTPSGNVLRIRFTDAKGKTFTFSREQCRLVLGLRSQRYTINGIQPGTSVFYVNSGDNVLTDTLEGLFAIGAAGIEALTGSSFQAITGRGELKELSAVSSQTTSGNTFVINGSGHGHNVGMSQWGAYSMAKVYGMSYADILTFYYTGAEIVKAA